MENFPEFNQVKSFIPFLVYSHGYLQFQSISYNLFVLLD